MVKQTSRKLFGMAKKFCLLTSSKILKLLMACNFNILTSLDKRMRNKFFNEWVQEGPCDRSFCLPKETIVTTDAA